MPIFLGFGLAFCLAILVVIFVTLWNRLWLWLIKILELWITRATYVLGWTALSLALLYHHGYHFVYVRDNMFSGSNAALGGKWDLGQVVVVLLWFPAFYQLVLATVVSMNTPRDEGIVFGFINILYRVFEMLCRYKAGFALCNCVTNSYEDEWHVGFLPVDERPKVENAGKDNRPAAEIREQKVKDEQIKKWVSTVNEKLVLSNEKAIGDEKVSLVTETQVGGVDDSGPVQRSE